MKGVYLAFEGRVEGLLLEFNLPQGFKEYDANSVDDVEHMIFDCVAMDAERQKHQSLFARGRVALVDFYIQDPTELAAFVHDCCKACKE